MKLSNKVKPHFHCQLSSSYSKIHTDAAQFIKREKIGKQDFILLSYQGQHLNLPTENQ